MEKGNFFILPHLVFNMLDISAQFDGWSFIFFSSIFFFPLFKFLTLDGFDFDFKYFWRNLLTIIFRLLECWNKFIVTIMSFTALLIDCLIIFISLCWHHPITPDGVSNNGINERDFLQNHKSKRYCPNKDQT